LGSVNGEKRITFIHTRAHQAEHLSFKGNDIADQLAKEAANLPQVSISDYTWQNDYTSFQI